MDFKQFTGAPLNYALWYLYRLLTGQDPNFPSIPVSTGASPNTPATITQIVKTVSAAATPEPIAASQTLVESVEIYARKAQGTANTGNVWIGPSSADGTNARLLEPGDSYTITAPAGKKIDLNDIYVDVATNGDGVVATTVN